MRKYSVIENEKDKPGQNEVSHFLHQDLLPGNEKNFLADIEDKTGFMPRELLSQSRWWGSTEHGASLYLGEYLGKKAVLKVQEAKPTSSEICMIESFARENTSRKLRPPYLYTSVPWNDETKYEALIMEYVTGDKVIHVPTTASEVSQFFKLFADYRVNCRQNPWVAKPEGNPAQKVASNFARWRDASLKIYPDHPLREAVDADLIDRAVAVLSEEYADIEPEFVHGHFSHVDLYKSGDQVVVFSNLFWSWRPPFYDAVFAYHWFIYQLNDVSWISPEKVEGQRKLWLSEIDKLVKQPNDRHLLNLALLERTAAGLNLDALSADPEKQITPYLVARTRELLKKYLKELGA